MTAKQVSVMALIMLLSACAGSRSSHERVISIADASRVGGHTGMPGRDLRVRGTVAYAPAGASELVVEDRTGGLHVHLGKGTSLPTEGSEVELTMHRPANASGVFECSQVTVLNRQEPPGVQEFSLGGLDSSRHLYHRVSVQGVIQAITGSRNEPGYVYIRSGSGSIRARTLVFGPYSLEQYIDSDIRVEGVLMPRPSADGSMRNSAGNYELWVSGFEEFRRVTAPSPPSAAPVETIGDLLRVRYSPPIHRIGLRGRVVFVGRGKLRLLEGTAAIDVELAPGLNENTNLIPALNSDVEAVGFLDLADGQPKVKDAVLTRTGRQARDCLAVPEPCGPPLRTALEVHRMDLQSASYHYPVELRAVVTYSEGVGGLLFVQDSTDGMFVHPDTQRSDKLRFGDLVIVKGATIPGGFAPSVGYASVRVIGRAPLPAPARDIESVFLGKLDCQFVEFGGVVEQIADNFGHPSLTVVWGTHIYKIELRAPFPEARLLLDRAIRVRGVSGALTNSDRQLTGVQLFVADLSLIHADAGKTTDPFTLPLRAVSSLLQFSKDYDFGHRVHLQAAVTFPSESGPTWIRDASGGIEIGNHEKIALAAGDVVEAVGFPRSGRFGLVLTGASLRRVRAGPPPAPLRISALEAAKGSFESQLVQLEGTLVDQSLKDGSDELTIRSGSAVFAARLASGKNLAAIRPGAVCRVTGICSMILDNSVSNSLDQVAPQGFRLLLRSPADVEILSFAPWLTSSRLMAFFSGTLLLAFAALIWVALLRRNVRSQTRQLSRALDRARNAESLEQDRKALLELVARNEPLDRILPELADISERHWSEARCSIQLQIPGHPRMAISPSLPRAFAAELETMDLDRAGMPLASGTVEPLSRLLIGTGVRSFSHYSAVPIKSGARALGAILVFFPTEPAASPYDRDILLSWGALASLAVERSGLYERLFFRAQYDDLTGLLNRGSLYEKLDHEIANARETGDGLGVLYLDLDNFKEINDKFGHAVGDAILRTVASRIRHSLRRTDFVGRVGGDEFVVLITGLASRSEAARIGSLALSSLGDPIHVDGRELLCGASLGLSWYPDDGDSAEQLMKTADHAMYNVKRSHDARVR